MKKMLFFFKGYGDQYFFGQCTENIGQRSSDSGQIRFEKKHSKLINIFICDPGSFNFNKIRNYTMLIYRYPKSKSKQIVNTRATDFTGINGISRLSTQLFLKTIPFYIKK